ncbi:MAG: hypothetical protein FWB80_12765, partial [Defluviitaleaceae bacterium]|nr:hypothetical protein [Defluviitaleaceae bacterium]
MKLLLISFLLILIFSACAGESNQAGDLAALPPETPGEAIVPTPSPTPSPTPTPTPEPIIAPSPPPVNDPPLVINL